ncbi:hypothetical protein HanPI659440_Chr07g0265731 [Helianthus annuus]|nr:hypothetical protein HanPI659440_Chr07g0265731 [Helianthus annuus]
MKQLHTSCSRKMPQKKKKCQVTVQHAHKGFPVDGVEAIALAAKLQLAKRIICLSNRLLMTNFNSLCNIVRQ